MRTWLRRVFLIAVAAMVGHVFGWVGGYMIPYITAKFFFLAEQTPLPHQVPEHPGGVSFRFAMAHDVIVERFARHGPAHYSERNRLTRLKLKTLSGDDPARFALLDDLAAGLERLGKSAEAVAVMRDKLEAQRKKGLVGRDLYTSYANLGTFLIHGSFKQALAKDTAAKERFVEGVAFVRKSVEVNPEAHFGRERWQAAIAEFLLATIDDPGLLKTFDCLGNRLDLGIEPMLNREMGTIYPGYGRPIEAAFSKSEAKREVPAFFRPGVALDDPSEWPDVSPIRRYITKVGAEEGWDAVPVASHKERVPFVEPTLGIIGMWRQGGGANPHFALALGETMLRVGQRLIAWNAFERASRLADRYSPDPVTQQFLRDHCRTRQGQIEETLEFPASASDSRVAWQHVSPPRAGESSTVLRARFDAELKYGEDFQRSYQQFEAEKIAAGVSIFDDHFFDDFFLGRASIASPVGPEEWFAGVASEKMYAYIAQRQKAFGVFGAGLAAMGAALLMRWRAGRVPDGFPRSISGEQRRVIG